VNNFTAYAAASSGESELNIDAGFSNFVMPTSIAGQRMVLTWRSQEPAYKSKFD
jgi:hypothetical protein